MEAVHEFDLFASRCPLFGGAGSEEFPCAHLTRLFMRQAEHFAELSTSEKIKKKGRPITASLLLHSKKQQHGCLRILHLKTHLHAQLLVNVVVVGHPVIGVDGYRVV